MGGGASQGNGPARTLNACRDAPVKAASGDVAAGKSRSRCERGQSPRCRWLFSVELSIVRTVGTFLPLLVQQQQLFMQN